MITFPLYPIARDADGKAFCPCTKPGCRAVGKHPQVTDWTSLRESVPLIEGQGFGLLTGHDCFVLDVDPRNGGLESFTRLVESREYPETLRVRSGSGGFHDYFKIPEGFVASSSTGKLAPGIDILGIGKYVVGPDSPHESGRTYAVERDVPMADPPPWLMAWIRENASDRGAKSFATWEPCFDETRPRRIEYQREYFSSAPLYRTGGGKHRYVLLLQAAGPGLLLDEDETLKNFRELYDSRLPPEDRWFPDHEQEFRSEVLRRAWSCSMEKGRAPNHLYTEREFFRDLKERDEAETKARQGVLASVRSGPEFGVAVPSGQGKKKTPADAAAFLASHEDWKGVFAYDDFREALVARNPPFRLDAETTGLSEEDITAIQGWFEIREHLVSWDNVARIVRLLAKQNRFHPVREYLDALPEGSPDVFQGLSRTLFGSQETADHDDFVLRKFFTAAYARVVDPGVKHDTILVLYGPQGYRKSSFVESMFSPWYRDQLPDLGSRDGSMALEGHWGIELAELDKLQRLESSTVKDFLSRRTDRYRAFGAKDKVERPRQCVFVGTTNDDEFLQDITGNRRWWIIEARKVIPTVDQALKDRIWSAARACYENGERHWLTDAEEAQAEAVRRNFEIRDPWEAVVSETLAKMGKDEVTAAEVLKKMFTSGLPDLKGISAAGLRRVARCLKGLGWTSHRSNTHRSWKKSPGADPKVAKVIPIKE